MAHLRAKKKSVSPAYKTRPPPSISDSMAWFNFADANGSGTLTQEEVISALSCSLRCTSSEQRVYIRGNVQKMWSKVDTDNSLKVDKAEFMNTPFVKYVQKIEASYKQKFSTGAAEKMVSDTVNDKQPQGSKAPSLMKEPEKWFRYYDVDKSDELSRQEVYKGLCQILQPKNSAEKKVIHECIADIWFNYDHDKSNYVDLLEFVQHEGMASGLAKMCMVWKEKGPDGLTDYSTPLYKREIHRHQLTPPPDFRSHPEDWFLHFDIDKSGYLTQKEVLNGLTVSCNAANAEQQHTIREKILSVWKKHDADGNGVYEMKEFLSMAEDLKDLPMHPRTAPENVVTITVYVPSGKKANDIIGVASPKTNEVVLLMIPDKSVWATSESGVPCFYVDF